MTTTSKLDVQHSFRSIMGRYATGVAVITASQGGRRYGMTVNSFTSVSLSPTMVLFCPSNDSTTWARIAEAGSFGVSLLAADQIEVSDAFARYRSDRFSAFDWTDTPNGHPVLTSGLGWIDCSVESVHSGGDHAVVLARAESWGCPDDSDDPLIFYRGRYRETA